jgi:hypothetical protein
VTPSVTVELPMSVPEGKLERLENGRFEAVIENDHGEERRAFDSEREARAWLDRKGAWSEAAE